MSFLGLVVRNIGRSPQRSVVIFLCVLVLGGFSLAITLIARGSEQSLRATLARLGADIVVVPKGVEGKVESALLTGKPTSVWMPEENLALVAAVSGVAAASPQIYLASLSNASCCTVSEMFLIVFDPRTDFTVQPWLQKKLGRPLALGEVIGGDYVFVPEGDDFIRLYGYFLTLKGNLEPTGTGLDQTMFMNLDTAQEMARISLKLAEKPLEIPARQISAVVIRVQPGSDARDVAARIEAAVPGVTAIESANLFRSARDQLDGLIRSIAVVLAAGWVVSTLLIAIVFAVSANERRREVGVLRALGSTTGFVFASLLAEAAVLALAGGFAGAIGGGVAVYLFHGLVVASLGIPFLFPAVPDLLLIGLVGLSGCLVTIGAASAVPALRISRREPALAMRE